MTATLTKNQVRKDDSESFNWNLRFKTALRRYEKIDGVCPELFAALIEMISEWAGLLPQSPQKDGKYIPANNRVLDAEETEIYAIFDYLNLQGRKDVADGLGKKFQKLRQTAENLDQLYKHVQFDELVEKRLTEHGKRQAAQLCNYLKELRKILFVEAPGKPEEKTVAAVCRAVEHFPTPSHIDWPQIAIRFTDGHNISVRAGKIRRSYHYSQLGMISRR